VDDPMDVASNLPAFLTNPVRQPVSVDEELPSFVSETGPAPVFDGDINGVKPRRPRARRVVKPVETSDSGNDGDSGAE
jgi:hypothetical protein